MITAELAALAADIFVEGESVFGRIGFPTLPFYRGNAWFTPLVMHYFDFKDGKKRRAGVASRRTNHLN